MQRWLSVLILLAAMAYWLWPKSIEPTALPTALHTPPAAQPSERSAPAPNASTKPAPTATAPRLASSTVAVLPASTGGARPKVPPNSVAFEVKNGLVIAFGDILIGRPTRSDFPERGFIVVPKVQRWKTREIAFSVHQDLQNPERVMNAVAYVNANTNVRFVPLKDQADSLVFAPTDIPLCLSYVGKVGGHQPIFLDDRCSEHEILHEIMHALGFIHEHSRPDRDAYVNVRWQNIEPDKYGQFEVAPELMSEPHKDRPFDYRSVTIYDDTAFGRVRGDITLESRTDQKIEPVPSGLSAEDIERLAILFPL